MDTANGSDRLRCARLDKGHSQEVAAEVLGVTREYVSYIESGKREPSKSLMVKIEKSYGVPILAWFGAA